MTEADSQAIDYSPPIAFCRANSESLYNLHKEIKRRKTSIEVIREEIAESKYDISDENL